MTTCIKHILLYLLYCKLNLTSRTVHPSSTSLPPLAHGFNVRFTLPSAIGRRPGPSQSTFLIGSPARPSSWELQHPYEKHQGSCPCSAGLCSPLQLRRALPWAELKLFSCFLFFVTSFVAWKGKINGSQPQCLGERLWERGIGRWDTKQQRGPALGTKRLVGKECRWQQLWVGLALP